VRSSGEPGAPAVTPRGQIEGMNFTKSACVGNRCSQVAHFVWAFDPCTVHSHGKPLPCQPFPVPFSVTHQTFTRLGSVGMCRRQTGPDGPGWGIWPSQAAVLWVWALGRGGHRWVTARARQGLHGGVLGPFQPSSPRTGRLRSPDSLQSRTRGRRRGSAGPWRGIARGDGPGWPAGRGAGRPGRGCVPVGGPGT
jgi:hypothetical protein